MILPFLFSLAIRLAFVQSQFVKPTSNLKTTAGAFNTTVRYKQVPHGICETTPGVNSYSGYVDVDEHTHVYWWFFEARNQNPTTAPLTVWLSGGPGASSMLGALLENGPCRIDAKGDPSYNPYSWTNASNVLYIDQPIDVGFSYSRAVPAYQKVGDSSVYTVGLPDCSCPTYLSDDEASSCGTWSDTSIRFASNSTNNAKDTLWRALQGFIGVFPQYSKSSGFHIACESFGGHYCPVYGNYILNQNSLIESGKLPGALQIDRKAVLIGNGWMDPILQFESLYNFSINPGNTYDVQVLIPEAHDQLSNALWGPRNCVDQLQQCRQTGRDDVCSAAGSWCTSMVDDDSNMLTSRYDIRASINDTSPPRAACDIYLNSPEIQEALGVVTNFTWLSTVISQFTFPNTGSDVARYEGVMDDIRNLTNAGVYVTQYHGDADYTCNWYGGEAVANEIAAPGFDTAGYQNLTSMRDAKVGGQVKQSSNYAFVRIYESGHEVPFYQPLVALELFNRTVRGLDIATGTISIKIGDGYKTKGPSTSDFREGNSTRH